MINKVIGVKPIFFYICKTTSYTWNGKIFCFINSWGCHMLNLVKQRSRSSRCPVSKNDDIHVDISRLSLPIDITKRLKIFVVLKNKFSLFAFSKSFSVFLQAVNNPSA